MKQLPPLIAASALVAANAGGQVPFTDAQPLATAPEVELHFAQRDGEAFDLYRSTPRAGAVLWLDDLRFLTVDLVGHALKDRLRLDLPAESEVDSATPSIRLPQGGHLYRVARHGRTALVLVRRGQVPRVLLEIADAADGTPGLDEHVHVTPDGGRALALAPGMAGDALWSVALDAPYAAQHLVTVPPPATIEPTSLRLGASAWFVADGTLQRVAPDGSGGLEALDHGDPEPIVPELALSPSGELVVAVALGDDGKGRVYVAAATGPVTVVTEDERKYSPPGYDHPLGPFLAVSPDDGLVAFRELDGDEHELFVRPLELDDALHLTPSAVFPNYIDSIGVFAFGQPRLLCFFAGDTKLGDFVQDEELSVADMYAVDLTDPSDPVFINVTRTNGDLTPPFTKPSTLDFRTVTVGPKAERIYLQGVDDDGQPTLACFLTEPPAGGAPNVEVLGQFLAEPAELLATPFGVTTVERPAEAWPTFSQPESKVDCIGDPALAAAVRIVASNKADPFDDGADVWFEGPVGLGEGFTLDASNAGKGELSSTTYVHVLDLDDTLLQSVEFHSSCSEPLALGDRFGAAAIEGAVGKDDTGIAGPCAVDDRPARLALRFDGGGCTEGQNSQTLEVDACLGDDLPAGTVHVLATNKPTADDSGAHVWFDGFVEPGEVFWVDSALEGKGHLEEHTWIYATSLDGAHAQDLALATDCSQPLVPGERFGAFTLVDVELEHPVEADDACATGRPRTLSMTYTGAPCGPVALGHELSTLLPRTAPDGVAHQWSFDDGITIDAAIAGSSTAQVALVTTDAAGQRQAWIHDQELGTLASSPLPARITGSPRLTTDGSLAVSAPLLPGLWGVVLVPGGQVVATAPQPLLLLAH